jgi:hypothetical protein
VTLDVSKLSGWLNFCAPCQPKGGHAMRGEVRAGRREGVGWWWRERRARGKGPTQGLGARARAERTSNMLIMLVTLEVSKLSGWLKAGACCRVERRACDAGGRGASREAGGPVVWCGGTTSGMHGDISRLKATLGAKGTRGERTMNM